MPAPSELDPARLRIGSPAEAAHAVTRSWLPDGRVVGWFGDPGVVVDAEPAGAAVPAALGAAYGLDDFWGRWTRAECAAKLADVPIAVWLRRHGLGLPPGIETGTHVVAHPGGDVVVSLARRSGAPTV